MRPWTESLLVHHTLLGIVGLLGTGHWGLTPRLPSSVRSVLFLTEPWGTAIPITYLLRPSAVLDSLGLLGRRRLESELKLPWIRDSIKTVSALQHPYVIACLTMQSSHHAREEGLALRSGHSPECVKSTKADLS